MDTRGIVFDIKRFALNDGPGLRTTVFLKGCPLACSWCHNPESREFKPVLLFRPDRCIGCLCCLEACPEGAISAGKGRPVTDITLCSTRGKCVEACPSEAREIVGREYTVSEIMEEVVRDRIFFEESGGGVTFSGGEPLAQPEFLAALLGACRDQGIHSVLDTSGYAENRLFLETASLADLVLFDLKAMDPETHLQLTGVYNKEILENIMQLSGRGTDILVRIPLIPGLNDDELNIRRTGLFVRALASAVEVELLPFHPAAREKHLRFSLPYRGPEAEAGPPEKMDEAESVLKGLGLKVIRAERGQTASPGNPPG